ncbi:hypothetical protein NRIC_20380 [Enterococcus florum]|uniref:Gram-positive pilin subunit D1 N-terminal domain-containing protein n=1 Tax=Enterococcus florum TaxID=2480627 RepID=A0A4P5P848_9ENTE|nr:pilin N-terminal domain-containing protein [Enterococcus florum]GCF94147.1 hypothetical protein NRIC_20380 [Enterococcus florum]
MKKLAVFFVSLLLLIGGIHSPSRSAAAEQEQVQVLIHTRLEGGEVVQGTEDITLSVYDLTSWRLTNELTEKEAKEFLLDKDATKETMKAFVENEKLQKLNSTPIKTDSEGKASVTVPRYQEGQDAAYLILAQGETGNQHLLPVVIFLPQYYPDTQKESYQLLFYGKYAEIVPPEPSEPPTSSSEEPPTKHPIEEPNEPIERSRTVKEYPQNSGKSYPQTNDVVRSYFEIGGLLVALGAIGLYYTKKKTGGRKNET